MKKQTNKTFTFFPYDKHLIPLAKQLRTQSTPGEIILWKYLKNGQMFNYDFHRQKPLFTYIVDFFCPKLNLAVELDGGTHIGKETYDEYRQTFLESHGIWFLRFSEHEVTHNIEHVLFSIQGWILEKEKSQLR